MKKWMNSNFIGGILFFVISIVILLLMPGQIDSYESGNITAKTIPDLLAKVMLVCSVALMIQGMFGKRNKQITITRDMLTRELRSAVMIGIFIVYAVLIPMIGFMIASVALAIALLAFYKVKIWYYYAIATTIVVSVVMVFSHLLYVKFP
jgi:hypothetical protein